MSDSPTPAGNEPGPAAPEQAPVPATAEDDSASPPDGYDPADYRWVPVRRRPRHDGWTEEKQRRFIEMLADTGLVGVAAKAVGMSRESVYRLRRSPHGAAFARAWMRRATMPAGSSRTSRSNARSRASSTTSMTNLARWSAPNGSTTIAS